MVSLHILHYNIHLKTNVFSKKKVEKKKKKKKRPVVSLDVVGGQYAFSSIPE